MKTVQLPDGTSLPALGLGTWHMGESAGARAAEVGAVRHALEIGYRVIDSAEMYADGGAEEIVGEALSASLRAGTVTRDEVFVVSKVYPHNASRAGIAAACDRSRKRLGLDRIDLYLLHWPGPHPLRETVAGFEALQADGRIRHWGVSNFDLDGMQALNRVGGGERCASNQVYLSPSTRGPEFDLLPWMQARRMPLMAYSPLDQGELADDATLCEIAGRHGSMPSTVALAWLIQRGGVLPIPKAVKAAHLRGNLSATGLALTERDLDELAGRFPPPRRKMPLAML